MKFKTHLALYSEARLLAEAKYAEDDAETWLKQYTLEALNKWPSEEVQKKLLKKYPFEGGQLYRGLNFANKEQYEKFLAETKDGTILETGSISSWSSDRDTTYAFAVTRPTYFLNRELMQAEDKKNKDVDFMIGHAGVILTTYADKGHGIHVNKSKHGKESEVILVPGTYKIKIHEKLIPFASSINKDNYKAEFMGIETLNGAKEQIVTKFQHIMFHYKEFDDEMSAHLFKLIMQDLKIKHNVAVADTLDWDKPGLDARMPSLNIGWNLPMTFFMYRDLLLPADVEKIDAQVVGVLKKIDAEYKKQTKDIDLTNKFEVHITPSLAYACKLEHYADKVKFLKHVHTSAAAGYHKLNNRENVKRINDIDDPHEKEKAIKQMTKDILATLKNIS